MLYAWVGTIPRFSFFFLLESFVLCHLLMLLCHVPWSLLCNLWCEYVGLLPPPCPFASSHLDGRHALDLEDEHCTWCGARCTASRSVISDKGSLAGSFVSYIRNTGWMLPFMQSWTISALIDPLGRAILELLCMLLQVSQGLPRSIPFLLLLSPNLNLHFSRACMCNTVFLSALHVKKRMPGQRHSFCYS